MVCFQYSNLQLRLHRSFHLATEAKVVAVPHVESSKSNTNTNNTASCCHCTSPSTAKIVLIEAQSLTMRGAPEDI